MQEQAISIRGFALRCSSLHDRTKRFRLLLLIVLSSWNTSHIKTREAMDPYETRNLIIYDLTKSARKLRAEDFARRRFRAPFSSTRTYARWNSKDILAVTTRDPAITTEDKRVNADAPWRLGRRHGVVIVLEHLYLYEYSTMGHPYTERGSCRDCVHDGTLQAHLMLCSVCRGHDTHSDRTLRRMQESGDAFTVIGVCHQLHEPLSQPTQD